MKLSEKLHAIAKRTLDCIGAGIGLVVLAPVFAAIWLTVRIKLGSPAIFAQQRPGKNGQLFTMLKFRSMLEEDPASRLVTDDQRSTPFGRRLRATSLDELPTLINVLKGDMSLVGPRPLNVDYLPIYSPHQARRHEVRPGVTGLAQVNGRNLLSWEARFDLDVEYVDRNNLWLDLKILIKTIGQVFSRSGIEAEGITTMTKFIGAPPKDGLTEHAMNERWHSYGERWQHNPRTISIGATYAHNTSRVRQWIYLDHDDTPVAICGLSDLGSQHVRANMLIHPEHRNHRLVHAVLNRLIHHGKSFDADHLTLRLPTKYRVLHRNAERLGFVASEPSLHPDHDTDTSARNFSLAIAAEKVA